MTISSVLSGAPNTAMASPITPKVESLLLAGKSRTIMGLFSDVTIEEKHKDEL
ncbi:hypothetical protein [Acinetobacter sp. HY1485]|uniref:hypothetical protein n=1 Tax=Acinetobacter sp. HY1485 TaxID=2970918 RepID=UPI003FA46E31